MRRNHPNGAGKFTYVDPCSELSRTFVWDDAGIDEQGQLVLLEEETKGIIPFHVEGHLARLKVMVSKGESIRSVVWIIEDGDFQALFEILLFYRYWLSPLPPMEIWSVRGVRLGSVSD